jgi:3-oxoacyl-[acyl-carrier-protein] synthase III
MRPFPEHLKAPVEISGWGMCVPEQVMTNEDLVRETGLDTSDEWIVTRTGIRQRHITDRSQATSDLATGAAKEALARAGLEPEDVDLVIVATASPDHITPSTNCLVQERLGAWRAHGFDLNAGCTGFLAGLQMACSYLATGLGRNVLLVGAELATRFINWSIRESAVLFGDGAGAVVLQPSSTRKAWTFSMRDMGHLQGLLKIPAGGSRHPASHETLEKGLHDAIFDGPGIFREAGRAMVERIREVLHQAKLEPQDVDMVVPHQANIRIIQYVANKLGLTASHSDPLPDRVFVNIDRYANTSTASIPIALCEAVEAERLRRGDLIAMCAFGSGLTSGAALVEW